MAEPTTKTPNLYALLIGIDYYQPGKLSDGSFYPSLGGCVRDINRVEDYLKKTLKPKQILKLTSPHQDISQPSETQDDLPTYENIVAKFRELTEIAQKDDQVYIHYSGHGGRAKTIYQELKGAGQLDEGLVPMDIVNPNSRYLRDVEIATLLKKMVDKGLVVTVVFDSCHSGGTTRGEGKSDIRGLQGDADMTSRPVDSLVASPEELMKNWLEVTGGTRNANTGDWLPGSNRYVLLAACRPSEKAYESAFNGNERNGVLTYWLLDALANRTPDLTYESLYDRIYAKVQSQFRDQTPMLFGEKQRPVFGSGYAELRYKVTVLRVDKVKNRVLLDVGSVQGIGKGAKFSIYAFGTTDFIEDKPLAIAEITEDISPTEAWAEINPDLYKVNKIEQAFPAVMLSAPVELVRRVRLFEKKEDNPTNKLPSNQVLPSAMLEIQKQALEKIKTAIPRAGKGWLELLSDDKAEHYQVAINENGEYEICDLNGTPYPNLRPPLRVDEADAAENVVKRLVHITQYKAAQELDNFSTLTNKLVVQFTDKNKKPLADPTHQTVQAGENIYLHIKNESKQILNVVVLDLKPDWAISQLDISEDNAPFVPFDPGQDELIPLRLSLPKGYEEGTDLFKVYATVGSAKFRCLQLPSLDKPTQSRRAVFDEYDENTPRGASKDPLDKLLEAVSADADPVRDAEVISSAYKGWTTKTVTVTIKA